MNVSSPSEVCEHELCVVDKFGMWTNFFCLPFALSFFRWCHRFVRCLFFFFNSCMFFLLLIFVLSLHHAYKLLFVWHNMHTYILWRSLILICTITIHHRDGAIRAILCTKLRVIRKKTTMLMLQLLLLLSLLLMMMTIVIMWTKAIYFLVALDTLSLYFVGSVCESLSISPCVCVCAVFCNYLYLWMRMFTHNICNVICQCDDLVSFWLLAHFAQRWRITKTNLHLVGVAGVASPKTKAKRNTHFLHSVKRKICTFQVVFCLVKFAIGEMRL